MKDTKGKEVPMTGSDVNQHKRMAAGEKIDGQKLPSQTKSQKKSAW